MRIVVYPHLMTVGGSQLNAIELAAAVRDRGHEVTVFAAETGPLAATVEQLDLPLVLAPHHEKRPSIAIARALRDLGRERQIDIVHGYEWPPCLEAFYGPRLCDRVVVGCTVMSMAVAPFIPSSLPLIVGTEQIAAAARRARSGPVRVVEPPVDTASNHPGVDATAFRARYGLDDRPTLVLVSRLATDLKLEGLERTMRAVGLLADDTGAQLVVVGDGPARAYLEGIAGAVNAATGTSTVILTGELADPRPAYAAGDVLLGMGGSALRAMAFAKPLVVLGERGFARALTPESVDSFLWQGFYGLGDGDRRPDGLAALVSSLLSDPARCATLGAYSRRLVEQRFSLVAAGERQELIYSEWLEHRISSATSVTEGTRTAAQVLAYKVRRRLDRWRGREASEDFNVVAQIAKTAELAEGSR